MKHNISDLDFCWAKDKGKYAAEQYFHVYGKHLIPRIATDWNLLTRKNFHEVGGYLPKISTIFHNLQFVNLPDFYLSCDMPNNGIAYVYIPQTNSCCGKNTILIHEKVAETLLKENAISMKVLRPAPVVDKLPGEYSLFKTQPTPRPMSSFFEQMNSEYEKLKTISRPIRMISEKAALNTLRNAKKEYKNDYRKSMPKAFAVELENTDYDRLVPYYLISNGGYLSDEYELLPYDEAMTCNTDFKNKLKSEETLETKPDGIVFARCTDGDLILLCNDSKVIRFSHEAPEFVDQWPCLAQFIVDAINN